MKTSALDKKEPKAREDRLWPKISYGCADIYGGGAFVVISTFFTVFLTKALGMPVALAGAIPLIGKIWDAVTDPVMGNIADRTRSRFGPKRFYLLIGSFLSALTFAGMWIPLRTGTTGQFIFYTAMYMLFSTGFTVVMVPYNALLPDMVEDYTARARFSSVRMIFSSFGAIIAGLVPTLLITDNTDPGPYLTVALIFSVIFLAAILLTFAGTWEREKPVVKISLRQSFTQSFTVYKSRSFRMLLAIFLFGQGAADFVTGLAVYYVDDVLNAYGGGNFTLLMGVILLSQFLGMILFAPVMARTSKRVPILVGTPVRMAATLALLLFSHEGASFVVILGLSFVIGLGMAGCSASIYAILSDMADVDELICTINRPGTCSGMATFVRKIEAGFSAAAIGLLLAIAGYDEAAAAAGLRQAASVQAGIANVYVFSQIILLAATLVFVILYPLGKKEFAIVKKDIARRRGQIDEPVSEEEKRVCERVTGFSYDRLWDPDNALHLKRSPKS